MFLLRSFIFDCNRLSPKQPATETMRLLYIIANLASSTS
ncbi:hypothetical protein SPBRAN_781 [uncultured Candidatus Thioglobus sp.]|nr:hypothetical protein SPBRAN_781 [uncultured Candidatus Thioglobus sp.]